jgi:AraC family transcriptional regulator
VQIFDAEPRLVSLADRTYMDDAWLTRAGLRLVQYDWRDPIERLSANALSHDILLHLLQTQTQRVQLPAIKGGLSPVQRMTIRDWIEAHLAENMTLSAMAEQLHLSEYHFAHMFKISFGMPPHNWVLRRRIERARQQLQQTNDDLLTIALQNGFANASHLSKHMKQLVGVPPGKYRHWSQIYTSPTDQT